MFFKFCADGQTLLTKNIDQYVKVLLQEGHYVEFVTNLSVTPVLEKFLTWDKSLLSHLTFKCSFHYIELKKKGLLETFAENVKKIWSAGASANIEITPSDELIPYINEVKSFSLMNFGALPHLTIARNDRTHKIKYLTSLSDDKYYSIWSQFRSEFWDFKRTIFGKKQVSFCYAGKWSIYIDLTTGNATPCYFGKSFGDVFADPNHPFPEKPVGHCCISHCYNGHALMTLGLIPGKYKTKYGDIRDRTREDGGHWLQPELKAFFNTKLEESNEQISNPQKIKCRVDTNINYLKMQVNKVSKKLKSKK